MLTRALAVRLVFVVALGASGSAAPRMHDPLDLRLPTVAAPEEVAPTVPEMRLLLHLGAREMDDDFFYEPVEKPIVLGFEVARNFATHRSAGLGLEFGGFLALDADDSLGVDVTSSFVEAEFGLRGRVNLGRFELYAGGGPVFVLADIDIENGPDENDTSPGLYYHIGALFDITQNFALGLDARAVTQTDIEFDGFADTDADYKQVTLVLGWRG